MLAMGWVMEGCSTDLSRTSTALCVLLGAAGVPSGGINALRQDACARSTRGWCEAATV